MNRSVQKLDGELKELLASKEPTFVDIDSLIARYARRGFSRQQGLIAYNSLRIACQEALLADFGAATKENIEEKLWDAHLKINARYRKLLSKFVGIEAKQRPVEKRKLEKRYLDFVKSSTRFYRQYIYKLSSAFGVIPELLKISKSLHFEGQLMCTRFLY